MGRRSRAGRKPVPDDKPVPVAERDPDLPPLWEPAHALVDEPVAPPTPVKKAARAKRRGGTRTAVPAESPLSVRQLAGARVRLRRIGFRLVVLLAVVLVVLDIIDSAAGGDQRALGHAFPNLWEPRVTQMLLEAAAVFLAFSFLIRLLPGGEAAAKLEHYLRRPRRPHLRPVKHGIPTGGVALGWELLAGLIAVGLAVGSLVNSAENYEPVAAVSVPGLTGVGLQPRVLVTGEYPYFRGRPQQIRNVRSDPDADPEDVDFHVSATVEHYADAAGATQAATSFSDEAARSQHYENDVITQVGGATVDRVDAFSEVQVGVAVGQVYVEVNVDGGYLGGETENRTSADGDRRSAQAVVAARALANAAPKLLDVSLPWWR